MRFRNTVIVAILFIAVGAWIYFVEFERMQEEEARSKLFAVERDRVVRVELDYPDRSIVIAKVDGKWRIREPLDTEADSSAVENLIRAVVGADVKRRVDDPPDDLEPFGLKDPQATVTLTLDDDSTLPAARIGKTSPVGNSTFVQLADHKEIALLPSSFAQGMKKTVTDLREKSILDFAQSDVHSVEITGEGGPIHLVRKDSAWTIEEPETLEADASEMRSFLSSLGSLEAERFVDEPEALDTYGLEPPRRTIVLETGEGDATKRIELRVGNPGDIGEKKGIYVKRPDRETVFHVGTWNRKTLDKDLTDFRDKTVLAFDPAAVRAILVARRDGASFRLERQAADGKAGPDEAESVWTLDGRPVTMEGRADNLLNDLHTLKGEDIAAENPETLDPWGLGNPDLIFTLVGEEEQTIGEISVGQTDDDGKKTYATSGATTFVYELRNYLYSHLDKTPQDFSPEQDVDEAPGE